MEKERDYGMFTNTKSNLSESYFEGANFTWVNFEGANLEGANLKGVNFANLTI